MAFCNLSTKDRVSRIGFGAIYLAAIYLDWPKDSFLIITVIMIAEGFIGWCGFATMVDMFQRK